jgi:hypothetical protein
MIIILKEPELPLEVNKVDIPTGQGWSVTLPEERKVLIRRYHDEWMSDDPISPDFARAIGREIDGQTGVGVKGNSYVNTY